MIVMFGPDNAILGAFITYEEFVATLPEEFYRIDERESGQGFWNHRATRTWLVIPYNEIMKGEPVMAGGLMPWGYAHAYEIEDNYVFAHEPVVFNPPKKWE